MTFTGRAFELNYLDGQYAGPLGTLCVVYGRRRAGKTRLMTHWLSSRGVPGFYWLATASSPGALLRCHSVPFMNEFTIGLPPIRRLPITIGRLTVLRDRVLVQSCT